MEMTTHMIRISKKLALAASLTAVVVGLGTGIAFASAETDTDNITPANTSFVATSTNFVAKSTINGVPITVTCKSVTISGTTPASGLGPVNINNPSFSGCTDNLHETDIITTNSTNGPWRLTFIDAANDESQSEPNTGDQLQVTIPKAGATFQSSSIPGCTVIVASNGPATITGAYDDSNTLSFSNASIPVQGVGCTASSVTTISATFKFNINLHDVS
jgi:hypothetical protein